MGRRNIQGGSKTKAMARKTSDTNTGSLIVPSTSEEKYAVVTAVLGSGRFRIITNEKKEHIGIVPGSMRGSKKRNNYVELNSFVLVNDRSTWQTQKHNSPADIFHIYAKNHADQLNLRSMFADNMVHSYGKLHMEDSLVAFENIEEVIENEKDTHEQVKFEDGDINLDLI